MIKEVTMTANELKTVKEYLKKNYRNFEDKTPSKIQGLTSSAYLNKHKEIFMKLVKEALKCPHATGGFFIPKTRNQIHNIGPNHPLESYDGKRYFFFTWMHPIDSTKKVNEYIKSINLSGFLQVLAMSPFGQWSNIWRYEIKEDMDIKALEIYIKLLFKNDQ